LKAIAPFRGAVFEEVTLFARKTPARSHRRTAPSDHTVLWTATTAVLALALAALSKVLAPGSVLPAMSILMVAAALLLMAGVFLAGFRLGHDPHGLSEVAALLMFLGCAGTMMTTSEQALALLGDVNTAVATASTAR
jgi:hypothetical protein